MIDIYSLNSDDLNRLKADLNNGLYIKEFVESIKKFLISNHSHDDDLILTTGRWFQRSGVWDIIDPQELYIGLDGVPCGAWGRFFKETSEEFRLLAFWGREVNI